MAQSAFRSAAARGWSRIIRLLDQIEQRAETDHTQPAATSGQRLCACASMDTGNLMPTSSRDPCPVNEGTVHDIERKDVGVDVNYGEVSILRCRRCRRCWLHYLMEYEYLTAAGRWLEGEITPAIAAKVKARNALKRFEKMESYYRGGSAYGGQMLVSRGPPEFWLYPSAGG